MKETSEQVDTPSVWMLGLKDLQSQTVHDTIQTSMLEPVARMLSKIGQGLPSV